MELWEKNAKINFLFEKVICDFVSAQLGVWFDDPKVLSLECLISSRKKNQKQTNSLLLFIYFDNFFQKLSLITGFINFSFW